MAPAAGADQEKMLDQLQNEQKQHNDLPSQKTAMPRWRTRSGGKTSIAHACTWVVDHQMMIAANILAVPITAHLFYPQARHHTQKFFKISYFNPATGKFALGWDDIFFVFYWIIVFTGLRCFFMDYILSPVARACGIKKKKTVVRFAEQAWILLYYIMFWSTGMYIMYTSDYWLDLHALWKNWPTREMDGLSKWYYLVQFAFWLQQIVVVNIEERRNDFWQMFSHHVITCILIFVSYGYHQSKVGTLFLCLMDIVDILLPAAKLLKYMKFTTTCDAMFGIFVVTWFATRHVLFPWVLWSIYAHIPQEIQYGCYRGTTQNLEGPLPIPNDWNHLTMPFRDPVGLVCWNDNIKLVFLALLMGLQVMMFMWFAMIMRVVFRVLRGQGADDNRSDDEDEEEEEEQGNEAVEKALEALPLQAEKAGIEREVFSDDPEFTSSRPSSRATRRREGGHSSGINVLGGSDKKELLGRIGCDRPVS